MEIGSRPNLVLSAILFGSMAANAANVAKTDLTHSHTDNRAIKALNAPSDAVNGATSRLDAQYRASAGRQASNQIMMAGFQAEQSRIVSEKPTAFANTSGLAQVITNSAHHANIDLHGRRNRVLGEFGAKTNPGEIYEEVKKIKAVAQPAITPFISIAAKANDGMAIDATATGEGLKAADSFPANLLASKIVFAPGTISIDQLLKAPQQRSLASLNSANAYSATSLTNNVRTGAFNTHEIPAVVDSREGPAEKSKVSPIVGLMKSIHGAATDLIPSIKASLADAKFIDVPDATMIKQSSSRAISSGSNTALELKPAALQLAYDKTPTIGEAMSRPTPSDSYDPVMAARARPMPRGGISYGRG